MAAAPVELWSTRLSCPQLHRRISSLPQPLQSATLGEPENPSLNFDPGCIKVVDTYRNAFIVEFALANKRWWRSDQELKAEEWKQYKSVLAPHLPYDALAAVSFA